MQDSNSDIKKIICEPIFIGYTEQVKKTKNMLLVFSSISLFLVFGKLSINSESSILGLKFDGLNESIIYIGLLIIIFFNLITFFWSSFDTYKEWSVRQTGIKKLFNTPTGNELMHFNGLNNDLFPDNPRNTTLYYWWSTQVNRLDEWENCLNDLEKKHNALSEILNDDKTKDFFNHSRELNPIRMSHYDYTSKIDSIQKSFEIMSNAFKYNHIQDSLSNFNFRYKTLLKSQNLRWILLDFSFPIFIAAISIISLLNKLY